VICGWIEGEEAGCGQEVPAAELIRSSTAQRGVIHTHGVAGGIRAPVVPPAYPPPGCLTQSPNARVAQARRATSVSTRPSAWPVRLRANVTGPAVATAHGGASAVVAAASTARCRRCAHPGREAAPAPPCRSGLRWCPVPGARSQERQLMRRRRRREPRGDQQDAVRLPMQRGSIPSLASPS